MEENDYIGISKYLTLKGLTEVEILEELESTLGKFILFKFITIEEIIINARYLLEEINQEKTDIEMTDFQLALQEKRKEKIVDDYLKNNDYYGIIKYFTLKGLNKYNIDKELKKTLKGCFSVPSLTDIQKVTRDWEGYVGFNRMYKTVTDIVINNCRLTLEEIAKMANERPCDVSNVLHKRGWIQLSCHWVPRLLTSDLKRIRMQVSKECLKYMDNQEDFMCRFVTFYEMSFYYTEQYTSNSHSKTRTVLLNKKVTAIIFWNLTGIVLINYIQNKEMISTDYMSILEYLRTAAMQMQSQLANKTLLFQQVDAHPIYTSKDAMQKHHELQHELLPHPPHSPDLAASNFHLLPKLKKWSANKKFTSYEEVQTMVNNYLMNIPKCEYESSILRLKYRWHYCIHLQGGYLQP